MKALLTSVALAALIGCSGGAKNKRPYPEPKASDILEKLATARGKLSSFSAASVMDYWVGKERVKGAVLVMGTPGAKVRFNAESPAGGTVLADMACNGNEFTLVDFQNNCQLRGPCNANSIAQLLRVPMQPDDFFYLALGQSPVVDGEAKLAWNSKTGSEELTVTGAKGRQVLLLEVRGDRVDIRKSELRTSDDKVVWSVENSDFADFTDEAGNKFYMPQKSRFTSPAEQSDLVVEWEERTINPTIDASKFVLTAPEGLRECGSP